jgi:ABC-2 type transport system ATP-binding protein
MIQIQNVSKSYGKSKKKSLNNVSAGIRDGSLFGLVGSNGAGKSTLLRIMAGIFLPDTGDVLYDGKAVYENNAVKRQMIYISDDMFFLPHCNLKDMMNFLAGLFPAFDYARAHELIRLFGLTPTARISTFSKGMQRQSAILLALACRPKYLLCDETFDGLDPVKRLLLTKLLAAESSENGMTVIIASHNLRELEDICDHIGLLHEGGILFESELDSLKLGFYAVHAAVAEELKPGMLGDAEILSVTKRGSLVTAVAKGSREQVEEAFAELKPEFFEIIPLTLEDMFIAEMEERGYDASKIIF